MAPKKSKSRPKKSSKPKTKKSIKVKAKNASKPKKAVMAKKSGQPKRNIAAIDSKFNGSYTSTVTGVSAMDGTLLIPDPTNSNNVVYTLSADGISRSVAPTFSGNLISFSFVKNSVAYSFGANTWTPSGASSGGEWTGTGSRPDPTGEQGSWTAKT